MIQNQNQYPHMTAMYRPMVIANGMRSQPSLNQNQYHQFPTMNDQNSPVSSLSLPLMVSGSNMNIPNMSAAPSSTSTEESLSNVSSVNVPTIHQTQLLTPSLLPYNPHAVTISPVSPGLCSPGITMDNAQQTAWIASGNNLGYAPQARLYSPSPASFVPYAQPLFTPSPPPMHFEAYQNQFQPQQVPQNYLNTVQQTSHFSSPQSNRVNPFHSRPNYSYQHKQNNFNQENNKKSPTRHSYKKRGGCVPVSMGKNRKNFRVRCKACSAPVSRQVVKEVKQEDLESAFADQNEILDQLPEFFGEPLLNFPEIVFYMQIFKAKSKDSEELQYFKVPRPAKERELHIDHRLTELFIRNFGFDHACEHHEFKRLPMHVPGICHARNLYRQLIVESLLPTFLTYVRNMDQAKHIFGIIFRYVGCATPRDIASNLPQVWKAVTYVDRTTSLEITGIVSLYNYHLFRRLVVKD